MYISVLVHTISIVCRSDITLIHHRSTGTSYSTDWAEMMTALTYALYVIFNPHVSNSRQPSIFRLGVLLLLFDVYLTWARIEKATSPSGSSNSLSPPLPLPLPSPATNFSSNATASGNSSLLGVSDSSPSPISTFLTTQPILIQYLFFLILCTLETVAFHLPIRTLLSLRLPRPLSYIFPHYPRPAVISTALLVSSFTKLFPLLLLIWSYDLPSSASAVSWAVIVNNVVALEILLDCGVPRAAVLAAVGAVCRAGVGWVSATLMTAHHMYCMLILLLGYSPSCGSRGWSCSGWCGGDRRSPRLVETHCVLHWLLTARLEPSCTRV